MCSKWGCGCQVFLESGPGSWLAWSASHLAPRKQIGELARVRCRSLGGAARPRRPRPRRLALLHRPVRPVLRRAALGHRSVENAERGIDLRRLDDERRREPPDGVGATAFEEVQAELEAAPGHALQEIMRGPPRLPIDDQLDAEQEAATADIADRLVLALELDEAGLEVAASLRGALGQVLRLDDAEDGQAYLCGHRIG